MDNYLKSLTDAEIKHICEIIGVTKTGTKQQKVTNIKKEKYKLKDLHAIIGWNNLISALTVNELKLICKMINVSPNGIREKIINKILNENIDITDLIEHIYCNGYNKNNVFICEKECISFTNKKYYEKCSGECKQRCKYWCENLFYRNKKIKKFYTEYFLIKTKCDDDD